MTAILAFIVKLLTSSGWKTYAAAAILGLLAANSALESAGIVFLPPAIVSVLTWLAGALGLVGVRHALARTEAAAKIGNRFMLLFLAVGLLSLGSIGCQQVATKAPSSHGCKCCLNCECGPVGAVCCTPDGCACKPGNKCSMNCDCKPAKLPFRLSALPEGPPSSYYPMNDGAMNGWWPSRPTGWDWWHDGKHIGTYDSGTWIVWSQNEGSLRAGTHSTPPWLKVPTGVNQSKLTTGGERLLISGEKP